MKRTYWESWSWAVAGYSVMLISQGSHLEKGQVGVRKAARGRAGDEELKNAGRTCPGPAPPAAPPGRWTPAPRPPAAAPCGNRPGRVRQRRAGGAGQQWRGDWEGCGHVGGCRERGRYGGCYQSVGSASSPAAAISALAPEAEAEAGARCPETPRRRVRDGSGAGRGSSRGGIAARGSRLVLPWNRWAGTKPGAGGTTLAQGNGRRVQPRGRGGARGRGNAAPHWPLCLGSSAAPSRTMENYHVLEMIGEGSFGRVYKGRRKHSAQVRGEVWSSAVCDWG